MSDLDRVIPQVYHELRRIAGHLMLDQRRDHTLEPTAVVHEAYLKLARHPGLEVSDRRRLLPLAARAMRQVLVDHARARASEKRGGDLFRVTLSDQLPVADASAPAFELLPLSEALERLERIDSRQVQVVELRYLAGLTVEEAAEVLGISPTLVKRETAMARAWLIRELS